MNWETIYNQLREELGRMPTTDEVQQRMLEIAFGRAK